MSRFSNRYLRRLRDELRKRHSTLEYSPLTRSVCYQWVLRWGRSDFGYQFGASDLVISNTVEDLIRIFLIGFILIIPVYLMGVRYISLTGQASVRLMITGKWSRLFWGLVVVIGMLVPSAAVIISYINGLGETAAILLYSAIFCGLIGDLIIRNLILRFGMYSPLIPASIVSPGSVNSNS